MKRISIRGKLVIAFALIAALPLALAAIGSYDVGRDLMMELEFEASTQTANLVSARLTELAVRLEDDIVRAGQDRATRAALAECATNSGPACSSALEALTDRLRALSLEHDGIEHVRLIDSAGRELLRLVARDGTLSPVAVPGLADDSTRVYSDTVKKLSGAGLFIAEGEVNRRLGEVWPKEPDLIRCAMPLAMDAGGPAATMFVVMTKEALLRPLRQQIRDFDGSLFLVDADWHAVGRVGEGDPPLSEGDLRVAMVTIEHGLSDQAVTVGDWVFLPRVDPLPGAWKVTGWSALIGYPKSKFQGRAAQLRLVHVLALGFALILALVGGAWLARRLVAPLLAIRDQATALGRGEFESRLALNTNDELEDLAEALNALAKTLDTNRTEIRGHTRQLEELVGQRTAAWREAQEKLMAAEKLASLGMLAGGVAHEINNPMGTVLTTVKLLIDTAREEGVSEAHMSNLRKIERQGERVAAIVRDLLLFARQTKLARAPSAVSTIVEEALRSIEHRIAESGISIDRRVATDLPPVELDSLRMQQVLANLVTNALDATPTGGRIEIRASLLEVGQPPTTWLEIAVEDSGSGIPTEALGHVFDPFFTTKPPGRGTGLGLSISYGIIKDHGGEMDVTSEAGRGTCIRLRIPVRTTEKVAQA